MQKILLENCGRKKEKKIWSRSNATEPGKQQWAVFTNVIYSALSWLHIEL